MRLNFNSVTLQANFNGGAGNHFPLEKNNLGNFSTIAETHNLREKLDSFDILYSVKVNYPAIKYDYNQFHYVIKQKYDLTTPSLCVLKLEMIKELEKRDEDANHFMFNTLAWFLLFLIISSLVSLMLNINHYMKLVHTFKSISKKYESNRGFYRADTMVDENSKKELASM